MAVSNFCSLVHTRNYSINQNMMMFTKAEFKTTLWHVNVIIKRRCITENQGMLYHLVINMLKELRKLMLIAICAIWPLKQLNISSFMVKCLLMFDMPATWALENFSANFPRKLFGVRKMELIKRGEIRFCIHCCSIGLFGLLEIMLCSGMNGWIQKSIVSHLWHLLDN